MGGEHDLRTSLADETTQEVDLGLGVGREVVDGHDDRHAVDIADILDVALEVDDALLECAEILIGDGLEIGAAVVLQGSDRGDDDGG